MPCYDIRDQWDSDHNNRAAELLCSLIKQLGNGVPWAAMPELEQWWKDHQNRDAYYARKANETSYGG